MSDSVRPHTRQPTRLPCPWDSPGKNTGVGCHFLLQCMKDKSESEVTQLSLTLSDTMDCSLPGSSIHGIFQARVLEWGAIAFSSCTLWLSQNKPQWPSKSNIVKTVSPVWHSCAGEPDVESDFSLLGESPCNGNHSPFCGSPTQGTHSLTHLILPLCL